MKTIDELVPRPSPDDQKAFIENSWINVDNESNTDAEAIDELNAKPVDDTVGKDAPF